MISSGYAALPNRLDEEAQTCLAVVECSRGERCKYGYDEELGVFLLKRLLPAGMSFPLDFGFVPSTLAEDGDPLDVMILHETPLAMGAVTPVRLIGVIEAEQTEEGRTVRNDRLIGVCSSSLQFAEIRRLEDLARGFVDTLTEFWEHYERLRGVGFRVIGLRRAAAAVAGVRRRAHPGCSG